MIFTFIYWMFNFLLFSILGFSIDNLGRDDSSISKKAPALEYYFMIGFVAMATLSAYLSIIIPLNFWVFSFIVLLGIVLFFKNKNKIKVAFQGIYGALPSLKAREKTLLGIGAFCLVAIASGEIWVSDTKLYHAQNIQWIQQFAVVPGLGNFQPQLGYNNMFFPITALGGQELPFGYDNFDSVIYPFNGIVISLLFLKLLFYLRREIQGANWWRTCFYLLLFSFCLLLFPRGINSPAPDYICGALTIYVFLAIEKKGFHLSNSQVYYLSSIILTTIIFKLSTLFLALLMLPLVVVNYNRKKLLVIAGIMLLIGAPFVIRNYYLSGYLVFPFPAIDLFAPEWKIANEIAAFEKLVITSWAKIPSTNVNTVEDMPFMEWFEIWWSQKDLIWKSLLLANILAVFSIIIYVVKGKKQLALLQSCILCNLLFWFANAPDPRFAFGFIFLGASLSLCSFLLVFDSWKYLNKRVLSAVLACSLLASLYFHRTYLKNFITEPITWLIPKGLPPSDLIEKHTNFTYLMPIRPTTCHLSPLPCATRPLGYVVLRDSTDMQKGFLLVEKRTIGK